MPPTHQGSEADETVFESPSSDSPRQPDAGAETHGDVPTGLFAPTQTSAPVLPTAQAR